MEVATIICIIIAIIALLAIGFVSVYNRFNENLIRINEVESNIDNVLRKRFDLLNKSISIIKKELPDTDPLTIIEEIQAQKMTNFELDRLLYQAINDFDTYKDKVKDPEIKKIEMILNETEAELIAYRKYYNDVTTDYNRLRHKFPTNLVALICKYHDRNYYDNKNVFKKSENFKL